MNRLLWFILVAFIWEVEGFSKYIYKNGTGPSPTQGQRVTVHYTGYFPNGTVFDSSTGRNAFQFILMGNQVIKGWDYAVASMKVGEKAQFEIPPDLAYGATGAAPDIPPNATLIFDIELLGVETPRPTPGPRGAAAPSSGQRSSQQANAPIA